VVHVPEDLRAVDVGHRTPLLERLVGGREGTVDVLVGAGRVLAERLAGRRVDALERLRPGAVDPLAVDVVT